MAAKRTETPAQRAARERNLKLSNPRAYTRPAPGQASPAPGERPGSSREPKADPPGERPGSAPGAPRAAKTYRGRPPKAPAPAAPRGNTTPPPEPQPASPAPVEPAAVEHQDRGGGGLFDDVLGSIFG